MQRDIEVTNQLTQEGWIVLRFLGNEIKKHINDCTDTIERAVKRNV